VIQLANVQSPTNDGAALCTNCGLCCDGTFYSAARLKPGDDRVFMQSVGVLFSEDEREFHLPCSCLDSKRCSIYERRFSTCREFRCRLLDDFESGRVTLTEALSVVATGSALRDALRAALREAGISVLGLSRGGAVAVWRRAASTPADRVPLLNGALRSLFFGRFRPKSSAS